MVSLKRSYKKVNQASQSGSRLLSLLPVMALSLLLVGSCNSYSLFSKNDQPLAQTMSPGEMMQHAQMLQDLVADQPETFLALLGQDIRLMLADPDLERTDNPTVAWQYRSQSCVLDVYFKTNRRRGVDESTAVHYELRPRGFVTETVADAPSPLSCLQSLYDDRRLAVEARFQQVIASRQQPAG